MMLTIALWLLSFVVIALSFCFTKNWKQESSGFISALLRFCFCLLLGLSFWTISSYSFWLAGFQLNIGTVQNGKMAENWWLPFAISCWTLLTYLTAKPKN